MQKRFLLRIILNKSQRQDYVQFYSNGLGKETTRLEKKKNVLLHLPTICIREYTQVTTLHTQQRTILLEGEIFNGIFEMFKIFSTLA